MADLGLSARGLASPTQGRQTTVNGANRDAPTAHLRRAQLPSTRAANALASRGRLPTAVTYLVSRRYPRRGADLGYRTSLVMPSSSSQMEPPRRSSVLS